MEVYISDISGNYNQIDVTDAELVRNRDFSSGDTFEFWASSKVAIPQRAFVKVTESGGNSIPGRGYVFVWETRRQAPRVDLLESPPAPKN